MLNIMGADSRRRKVHLSLYVHANLLKIEVKQAQRKRCQFLVTSTQEYFPHLLPNVEINTDDISHQ